MLSWLPEEVWGRLMDPLVRHIDNATHQRKEIFGVASNRDDTSSSLPMLEGKECTACGQLLPINGRRLGALDGVELPAGVRFDPSDEELLRHLASKVGTGHEPPHPLIDDFIAHLDGDEGICQTHPERLPGVRKDGSSRHFFHKPAKAYTTGSRKRRKIHNEDEESGVETRWHKTGKTRRVTDGGNQLGWKKIMVLYEKNSYSGKKKAKSEKTNWILHQYHLGPDEEERDGELVVCKVFYQKQPRQCTGGGKQAAETAIADGDCPPKPEASAQVLTRVCMEISTGCGNGASRGTLITPKRDAPHRPQFSRHRSRESSPRSQAHLQQGAAKTPAQSGWGSDMTVVIGRSDLPNSEITSSLGFPSRPPIAPFSNVGIPLTERIHYETTEIRRENGTPDWNQEESTSGKPCEGVIVLSAVEDFSRGDGYALETCVAARSQAPEIDSELIDNTLELRCTEEFEGIPFFGDLGVQSFEDDAILFEGHAFEGVFNPNPDYPDYGGILMDTPPSIQSELRFSSQEVSEMWTGCDFDPNDSSDNLSST
ncbi:hypothetical protein R1flu_003859 [Riccia fluitans]|uniref:NAC domain-containing protein n=1 Tax=Riccia fluitans TaxID=41844 RepID=A0ABD1YA60_9MARC